MLVETQHEPVSLSNIVWDFLLYFHHVQKQFLGWACNFHNVSQLSNFHNFYLCRYYLTIWRNVIPIYLLSIWLFLFSTKFVNQTNIFGIMNWLKSFVSLFTYFVVYINYLLNLLEPKYTSTNLPSKQGTNGHITSNSYFTQTKLIC